MIIQIRFTTDRSFVSTMIRWFTWGDFSHCEFVIPPRYFPEEEYKDGGFLGAHVNGGVKLRPFGYSKPSRQAIGEIHVPDDVGRAILDFAKRQIGKPYDVMAVLGFAVHQNWEDKRKWFCSEFIIGCCSYAGFTLLNILDKFYKVDPQMIYDCPLVFITQGAYTGE